MAKNFDEAQQFGKGGVEATMKSFGAFSKSVQAIATEAADYSKKVFEDGTAAAVEKPAGAKTLDKAVEVQSDYFKKTYEAFVSQATKVTELYADLAKETYKPFEGYVARAGVK